MGGAGEGGGAVTEGKALLEGEGGFGGRWALEGAVWGCAEGGCKRLGTDRLATGKGNLGGITKEPGRK